MLEPNKIYCGDCLDLMKEIPDKSIDLVLTDPPYGIDIGIKTNRGVGVQSKTIFGRKEYVGMPEKTDFLLFNDNEPINKKYIDELIRISKNQVLFGGNYFELPPSSCWIVWNKDNGSNDFADCELAWTSFKTAVRMFTFRWNGLLQQDMKHKETRYHPTQKPVALFRWILEKYTEPGMTILDPFAGSCTTAVACIKTGRNFICIEKEPEYCKIGEKRIAALPNTKLQDWFE